MDDISELDKIKANLQVQDNCWENYKEYRKRSLRHLDKRNLKKSKDKHENRQEDR